MISNARLAPQNWTVPVARLITPHSTRKLRRSSNLRPISKPGQARASHKGADPGRTVHQGDRNDPAPLRAGVRGRLPGRHALAVFGSARADRRISVPDPVPGRGTAERIWLGTVRKPQ